MKYGYQYSQNNKTWKVCKGIVRNVRYSVERQRQRLQGGEVAEWVDGNFCQTVVIQPKVTQLHQTLKTVLWYGGNVVSI